MDDDTSSQHGPTRTGTETSDAPPSELPRELLHLSKDALHRVRALKQLQRDELDLQEKYFARIHELEVAFEKEYEPIRAKRAAIVKGEYEPADDECQLPLIHDASPQELQKLEDNASLEKTKGIPDFWLSALTCSNEICGAIKESDTPALRFLEDISCEMHADPPGYTLSFHFAENPFFTNIALKKHYQMSLKVDPTYPFDYDGPIIESSYGEKINWREGKDLTQMEGRKKRDACGQIIHSEPSSFFSAFFSPTPKKLPDISGPIDDDEEDRVLRDFEMGEELRQKVIPRAVLFLTGEVDQEEDYNGYSDYSGDSGDSDDSDLSGDSAAEDAKMVS